MRALIGLLLLGAVVYALYQTITSNAPTSHKVLWSALVILAPVVGLIIWAIMGPGSPVKG